MHLSSISLKGFKSFPERTKLTFSPGVSVIVGPNGSGKSNITDAVLWAMGEQSPVAVRGQSMQDVIFAGGHGVQARSEAEVEVVLDNASGGLDLPVGEVSIVRRLNRAGDGEYRVNGAKCRLVDVIEILSDTGLGKEMHSVVSQGRVEAIVTSKPRDRRMLIEEAAGLGKHRKRRRRAQLKLERTQDNLDRALDVEREARTRLKPLKRQAEAAELHERIERQSDEARWTLARDGARSARAALRAAEAAVAAARAAAEATEAELRGGRPPPRGGRGGAVGPQHRARGAVGALLLRPHVVGAALDAARSRDPCRFRAGRPRGASARDDRAGRGRGGRRSGRRGRRGADRGAQAELAELAEDYRERLERELAELEARREAATALVAEAGRGGHCRRVPSRRGRRRRRGRPSARRELDTAAEAARRESAKVGAELAKVNQFLRANAGAPGGAPALADTLSAAPGYELALAAALGPRLRAAVAPDLASGAALLERAGKDGGAALIVPAAGRSHGVRCRLAPPARRRAPLALRARPRRRTTTGSPRRCSPTSGSSTTSKRSTPASAASRSPATGACGRPHPRAAADLGRRRGPRAQRAQPARRALSRSRRPRRPSAPRSRRSKPRRRRSPRPTRRGTRSTARRAPPPAPATRPPRPNVMPAGSSSSGVPRPTRARARSAAAIRGHVPPPTDSSSCCRARGRGSPGYRQQARFGASRPGCLPPSPPLRGPSISCRSGDKQRPGRTGYTATPDRGRSAQPSAPVQAAAPAAPATPVTTSGSLSSPNSTMSKARGHGHGRA